MRRGKRLPDKDVTKLIRSLNPGFRIERGQTGHAVVVGPDGQPVRNDKGIPLSLPGTPTSFQKGKIVKALRKAGALK